MPYKFILTDIIPATPQEIYDAWLDSELHTAMTGGEATASPEVGGSFTAWDGYIWGENLELAPGARIVQSWRTSQFTDEHEDSVVTVMLTPFGDGTLVSLEHANVPDEQTGYEESGWREHYFVPMKAYFGEAAAEQRPARKKAAAKKKPATKKAAKKKTAGKRPAKKKAAAKKKSATRKSKKTATKRKAKKAAPTRKKTKARKASKSRKTGKRKVAKRRRAKR